MPLEAGARMFFSMNELYRGWAVQPKVILHVGAHKAEEFSSYKDLGPTKTYWIEANPILASQLSVLFKGDTSQEVIEAAAWDQDGLELELIITNNTQSSSILKLKKHRDLYPDIFEETRVKVQTKRLDTLLLDKIAPDFINLDIQGSELRALMGAQNLLANCKWIYSEVNKVEIYEGCCLVEDLDKYLSDLGFRRECTRWFSDHGWGDALYVHQEKSNRTTIKNKYYMVYYQTKWYIRKIIGFSLSKLQTFIHKLAS